MTEEVYVAKGHRYEAEVTPAGYGSRILIDGVEMPDVKSFCVEASVDSASLNIEVLALAKVAGIAERITLASTAYVITDAEGNPVRVCLSMDAMRTYLRENMDLGFETVPIEVSL